MECKFLKHGMAPGYNSVIKPCCVWNSSDDWKNTHNMEKIDLVNWHKSADILENLKKLESGQWPASCRQCEKFESQGRTDSMRLNGNQAYRHYQADDITLEIRPGSTCNFACQTCWPEASSRVAQYYHQLGLIDIKQLESQKFENFDLLLPIASRIRDVVVLGGEPFYDKSCKKFLSWAEQNLSANIMMFTNGSMIDWDFLNNYSGKITLIFSLDAIGRPAEYIRFGTVWSTVFENFQKIQQLKNVELRVNITTSFYNYIYIEELITMLCQNWPTVVSFGSPRQDYYTESAVPEHYRAEIIASLERAVKSIVVSDIEIGQKQNAAKTLVAHVDNLKNIPWSSNNYQQIKKITDDLDRVKGINVADYCEFTARMLSH
jgi:molybdenum cofactor biosynthesis enzyme MoaA